MRWTRDKEALAGDTTKNRDGPDKNIFFDKRGSACVQKEKQRMDGSGEEILLNG
jgi:hypothetical protein